MGKVGRLVVALTAVAAVATGSLGGAANARSATITLKARSAGSLGKVLAAPNGRTLYRLRPEVSRDLLCTSSSCLRAWPPLLVASKSTTVKLPQGITGSIGFVKRGRRYQATLSGWPLYRYASDTASGQARGQSIRSFGGTWVVLKVRTPRRPAPAPEPEPPPDYPPYY